MPREHLEFIQAQDLPWAPLTGESARSGADIKILSRDESSQACSTIIRYSAGWSVTEPHSLTCDEEFYVLDGTIRIGEIEYNEGDYAYLPAGFWRNRMESSNGSAVLTFFEGRAENAFGSKSASSFDSAKLIAKVSTSGANWIGASDPKVASSRVGRLVLRPDSPDGERTWLLHANASADEPFEVNGVEQHPCVEEMFLLEGDFAMTCGLMRTGAYFWRPPMIKPGPMGTRNGFLGLFRAKEGGFSTQWSDPPGPIEWDAAYEPVLPDGVDVPTVGYDERLRY